MEKLWDECCKSVIYHLLTCHFLLFFAASYPGIKVNEKWRRSLATSKPTPNHVQTMSDWKVLRQRCVHDFNNSASSLPAFKLLHSTFWAEQIGFLLLHLPTTGIPLIFHLNCSINRVNWVDNWFRSTRSSFQRAVLKEIYWFFRSPCFASASVRGLKRKTGEFISIWLSYGVKKGRSNLKPYHPRTRFLLH